MFLPNLNGTHIDGAVFYNKEKEPVIALTLRYDRLDNFWFTLFHELSHLALHFKDQEASFFDDLKCMKDLSQAEKEADQFARDRLIPGAEWESFYSEYLTAENVIEFAQKSRISPAIVAGRIERERDDYRVFRGLLGQGKVKKLFLAEGKSERVSE